MTQLEAVNNFDSENMIPYAKQCISEEDVEAVSKVLRSDFLTCGPKVEEFEKAFAQSVGAKYAVACSSGTAALHLAMLAAEIGIGDRVITSPITFLSSANAARFVGAEVDFCDIEPVTATLDAGRLERDWKTGTKAVVAVDYAGHPADLQRITRIAHSKGAIVIEDACHSVGGVIKLDGRGYAVGAIPGVDMTAFSFHAIKTMTTGEGGMITTDNPAYAERARRLRSHGMERNSKHYKTFGKPPLSEVGPWSYEMQELGYNYRLTDFQSALGLSQLKRLPDAVGRRSEIVSLYSQLLREIEYVELPGSGSWLEGGSKISWHLFSIRIDFEKIRLTRSQLMEKLRDQGIGTQVLYIPVSLQPYYQSNGAQASIDVAFDFYQKTLALPLYPDLTDSDIKYICEKLISLIRV